MSLYINWVNYSASGYPIEPFQVIINTPINGSTISQSSIIFNITTSPHIDSNLTNLTLFVWNSDGSLFNISGASLSGNVSVNNIFNVSGLGLGSYYYNALACSSNSTNTV